MWELDFVKKVSANDFFTFLELKNFLIDFRNAITCCTRRKTRRTSFCFTRAEIVTTKPKPTATASTLTKSCTKLSKLTAHRSIDVFK